MRHVLVISVDGGYGIRMFTTRLWWFKKKQWAWIDYDDPICICVSKHLLYIYSDLDQALSDAAIIRKELLP